MAALKPSWSSARVALGTIVSNHAHAVFSRQWLAGLFIMAALATEPRCLGFGLCAMLAAELASRVLGLRSPRVSHAYNALLCGVLVARELPATPGTLGLAIALGGASVFVTAGVSALAGYAGHVPVLSLPFVLCSWFLVGLAPHLRPDGVAPAMDAYDVLPSLPVLVLQTFGGFVLVPQATAGAFVLAALLVHSRISTVLALGSGLSVLLVLQVAARAGLAHPLLLAAACNAGLAALSIGGIWLVPSRRSSLVALGTAWLTVFFSLGFWTPLSRLGLPVTFVPFNVALILVVSALRERAPNHKPALAPVATETPEELLANYYNAVPGNAVGALVQHLPFAGAWICTQAVDGPYTHRGILRHAYDFEMLGGADGALCGGTGHYAQDYHCFGQPVLAVADGTVAAIENTVPNNAVGEDNPEKPWGNYVVLYHATGVYSVVAHLSIGSVVVYPGQFITRGMVLGYCGNSGRAPRPHLHFQLQTTVALGSATLPCCFHDVVVKRASRSRFEATHSPEIGDTVQTLVPDYALGALFDLPLGTTLTYRMDGKTERVVSALDVWGRSVLRSLDRGTELVVMRTERRFGCQELYGNGNSVLMLLRLALPEVPLGHPAHMAFRGTAFGHWANGRLRRLLLELAAPFCSTRSVELEYRVEPTPTGIEIKGAATGAAGGQSPLIQTRVLLGGGIGPRVIEVVTRARAYTAELVDGAESLDSIPSGTKRARTLLQPDDSPRSEREAGSVGGLTYRTGP